MRKNDPIDVDREHLEPEQAPNGGPSLQELLNGISRDALADYWRFAASDMQSLVQSSSEHKALCLAVKGAEREDHGLLSAHGLPLVPRQLSASDLQKAVLRLKGRLLESPIGLRFATKQFGRWIQERHQAALLAALDAMDCPHTEGTLTGPAPVFSAEDAVKATARLAVDHQHSELALVYGALILNGKNNGGAWDNLMTAFASLQAQGAASIAAPPPESGGDPAQLAASRRIGTDMETSVGLHAPGKAFKSMKKSAAAQFQAPISAGQDHARFGGSALHVETGAADAMTAPGAPERDPVDGLTLVRNHLMELKEKLECAIQHVERGEAPELGAACTLATSVSQAFTEISQRLGNKILSVTHWEQALSLQSSRDAILAITTKCEALVHATDPAFPGLADVERVCRELREVAGVAPTGDRAVNLLGCATALIRVVEEGGRLDDLEANHLNSRIREAFDQVVATAALRGNLVSSHAIESPSQVQESARIVQSGASHAQQELEIHTDRPGARTEEAAAANHDPLQMVSPSDSTTVKLDTAANGNSGHGDATIPASLPDSHDDNIVDPGMEFPSRLHPDDMQGGADGSKAIESYLSYQPDFTEKYWINRHGDVAVAPWCSPEHVLHLVEASDDAWDKGRVDLAYLFARAAMDCGGSVHVDLADMAHTESLLDAPSSPSSGVDPERTGRLRKALIDRKHGGSRTIGLSLMLEAVRPALPGELSSDEIEQLVSAANYKDPALSVLVGWMLKGWLAGSNPLLQLRNKTMETPPEDPKELMQALHDAEEKFRATVAACWSAAGGRLQHTHCRRAWSSFIQQEITELRSNFGCVTKETPLNAAHIHDAIQTRLRRMRTIYTDIMDKSEVRHQDRTAADGATAQIAEALLQMAGVLQRMELHQRRSRTAFNTCPEGEARRVLQERSSDATDRICAVVFGAVINGSSEANPFRIPVSVVARVPDLVKCLKPDAIRQLAQLPAFSVEAIRHPVSAASLLLDSDWTCDKEEGNTAGDIVRGIREFAIEHDRRDMLSALSPADILEAHERTLLLRSALDAGEKLFIHLKKLEKFWGICEELMVDDEKALRSIVDEARKIANTSEQINFLLDGRLVEHWLKLNLNLASCKVQQAMQSKIELGRSTSPGAGELIENYFRQGRYREVMAFLHTDSPPDNALTLMQSRQTLWRADAKTRFDDPARNLLSDLLGKSKEQQALVKIWVGLPQIGSSRDQLHKLLYAVVSGEAERSRTLAPKRSVVNLTDLRDHRDRKTLVDCTTLREYFQAAGLNPTFLPQLADYAKIVITSSGPAHSLGVNVLDEWARIVAGEPDGSLVVFLEPGLPTARRDELSVALRRRNLRAAIIDDLDLCRLCTAADAVEGSIFVALLEIVLEQLDLERVSPFSTHDGQHVRVETFVGRTSETDDIALRGKYSRLFSGRKLGKSALLKYVAKRYDQHKLPSGNRLQVIFITIAGGESEQWVASCIIDEMVRRFELPEGESSGSQRPRDRLAVYMNRFLQARPRESVLLILDEADTFVEGQLASYDQDRESSLSFCLLKELPAQVDQSDLPRVRTIFSGYRVTNTRDGVWANAGDVLVLRPLQEEEATKFIEGMLARVGVDIREHASYIARRCGRQPAVLIRFGEALLKHLSRTNIGISRDTIRVTESIVTIALTDQSVVDEIRTVVANNFQGNRVGQAIFAATLLVLKDLTPGHALMNGPTRIVEKLKEIDADLGWLERIDASPTAVVEMNLQEFMDRELLTVSDSARFGERAYRLKFPHFLPVLTQTETGLELRKLIRGLRDSQMTLRLSRCALAETALDTIRYWYREATTTDCSMVVVGGHWTSALVDAKCGVPDRLGCGRSEIEHKPDPAQLASLVDRGVRVFLQPDIEAWPTFLGLKPQRPIIVIGGIDWLRHAMRYALEGGAISVEVVGQGRLPEETLRWWLEGARALDFQSNSTLATDAIVRLTGGVPLLVRAFDESLPWAPASVPSDQEVRVAMTDYERRLDQLVSSLGDQTSSDALTPREMELLSMAVRVATEFGEGEFALEGDFAEYWDSCATEGSQVAPPMSLPEDRQALQLLIACGLLPVTDERASLGAQGLGSVRIDPDGPIARLAKKLGHAGAA